MTWAVAAVLIVVGLWAFTRSRTLFVLSVRDGRVLVVRGRIPGRLLQELRDVVSRPPVRRATIRAWASEDGGHLSASGVDEGTEQRLRNVFRLYPISQLRNAPRIAQPTVGQLLGIAWLAWLFERSVDDLRR
jgi:hypothetical protein